MKARTAFDVRRPYGDSIPGAAPPVTAHAPATGRLLRIGSIYALGTAIQALSAVLVLPVLVRLIRPSEYGVVALALAIAAFATMILGLGMATGITRLFYDGGTARSRLAAAQRLVKSTCLMAFAGTAIIAVSSLWWGERLVPHDRFPLLLAVLIAFVGATITAANAVLRVQERARLFVTVSIVQGVGGQILGLTALAVFNGGAATYLAGYLGGGAIAAVAATSAVGALRARRAPRSAVEAALRIGLPSLPGGVAVIALGVADRIVLQGLAGSAAVGRYNIAYLVGSAPLLLIAALQQAWMPMTFAAPSELRWKQLSDTTTHVLGLAAAGAGILALLAPIAMVRLLPAHYHPAQLASVTAAVAFAAIPWTVFGSLSQVFVWSKNTVPMGWIVPTAAICNIGLVYALYYQFGLAGVAAATPLALIVGTALMARASRDRTHVPWDIRTMTMVAVCGLVIVTLGGVLGTTTLADEAVRVAVALVVVIGAYLVWKRGNWKPAEQR